MVSPIVVFEFYFPKLAALLSMLGSCIIIGEIVQDSKAIGGVSSVGAISRILLFMSMGDIFSSLAWFMGAWVVPRDYKPMFYRGHASGSERTCRFQGFILQFGLLLSLLFSASLAIFYLLLVKYKWTKKRLISVVTPLSIFVLLAGLGSAVSLLVLDLYHPVGPLCWINSRPLPEHCGESENSILDECQQQIDATPLAVCKRVPLRTFARARCKCIRWAPEPR